MFQKGYVHIDTLDRDILNLHLILLISCKLQIKVLLLLHLK
jgi:hypothetical protein